MRLRTIARRAALGLVSAALLAVVIVIPIHAHFRRLNEEAVAIHTPNGIEEAKFFTVGGIKQWVQIRGENRDNPVLLFLHGGPGASSLPISSGWRTWEKRFTVVQWDQRGTGRTYRENSVEDTGTLTIERMTADGLELAEQVRRYMHKDKLLLVGHSWGSILGIYMIKQRPALFSAFVGTGQVVDAQENELFNYAHVMEQARAANNSEATKALVALGPPPWDKLESLKLERQWGNKLAAHSGDPLNPHADFTTPQFSLLDYFYWMRSRSFSMQRFGMTLSSLNLRSLGFDFAIPVFFFEGTADQFTPIEPAEEYLREIVAPHKEMVRFEGDHHFVVFNRPEAFLKELTTRVVPWIPEPKAPPR